MLAATNTGRAGHSRPAGRGRPPPAGHDMQGRRAPPARGRRPPTPLPPPPPPRRVHAVAFGRCVAQPPALGAALPRPEDALLAVRLWWVGGGVRDEGLTRCIGAQGAACRWRPLLRGRHRGHRLHRRGAVAYVAAAPSLAPTPFTHPFATPQALSATAPSGPRVRRHQGQGSHPVGAAAAARRPAAACCARAAWSARASIHRVVFTAAWAPIPAVPAGAAAAGLPRVHDLQGM
jgi:hypothetical protein